MSTYNIPQNSSITINDTGKAVTSVTFSGLVKDFTAPDSPLTAASVAGIVDNAGSVTSKTITLAGSVVDSLYESTKDIARIKGFSIVKASSPFCIEAATRTVITVTGSNAKQSTTRDVNDATAITSGSDIAVSAGKSIYLWNTSGTVTLTFVSGSAKLSGSVSSMVGLTISDTNGIISNIDGLVFSSTASENPTIASLPGLTSVDIAFPGNVNLAGWFENCTLLTTANITVAGNLTGHSNLFKGCTSLIKATLVVSGTTSGGASTAVMTNCGSNINPGTFYVGGSIVGKFTLPANQWTSVNITDTTANPLPLGIVARTASTVKLYMKGYAEDYDGEDNNRTFQYSLDNSTWSAYTPNTVINLAAGKAIFFKGNNGNYLTTGYNAGSWNFTITGSVDLIGCVSSLLNNGANTTVNPCENCFMNLFSSNSAIVDASKLDMNRHMAYPGDSDGTNTFAYFLFSCTGLKKLPILPSKIMRRMLSNAFSRCSGLEYAYLEADSAKSMGLENGLSICSALTTVVANITSPSNALTFSQLLFTNVSVEGTVYFPKAVQSFTLPAESVPVNWTIKYF